MADSIRINGKDEPLLVSNLAALIAERAVTPGGRGVAVARNGTLVPRAEWAGTSLRAGDTIEIVLAKQGG